MDETDLGLSERAGTLGGGALLVAVGAALFWTWRKNAPVSRHYYRMKRRRERSAAEPNGTKSPE